MHKSFHENLVFFKDEFYRLNCVPAKFICLNLNPQCDRSRDGAFGRSLNFDEVVRVEPS